MSQFETSTSSQQSCSNISFCICGANGVLLIYTTKYHTSYNHKLTQKDNYFEGKQFYKISLDTYTTCISYRTVTYNLFFLH
jgi:hypothetical protein